MLGSLTSPNAIVDCAASTENSRTGVEIESEEIPTWPHQRPRRASISAIIHKDSFLHRIDGWQRSDRQMFKSVLVQASRRDGHRGGAERKKSGRNANCRRQVNQKQACCEGNACQSCPAWIGAPSRLLEATAAYNQLGGGSLDAVFPLG